jgi:hypothetical protein
MWLVAAAAGWPLWAPTEPASPRCSSSWCDGRGGWAGTCTPPAWLHARSFASPRVRDSLFAASQTPGGRAGAAGRHGQAPQPPAHWWAGKGREGQGMGHGQGGSELQAGLGGPAIGSAVAARAAATTQHSMDGPRRSERKRTQTDFLGATETLRDGKEPGRRAAAQAKASRARAAAIAAAYEPLGGLVQLGEAGGGEGSFWVGEDSPALGSFAPTPGGDSRLPAAPAPALGPVSDLRRPVPSAPHGAAGPGAVAARVVSGVASGRRGRAGGWGAQGVGLQRGGGAVAWGDEG